MKTRRTRTTLFLLALAGGLLVWLLGDIRESNLLRINLANPASMIKNALPLSSSSGQQPQTPLTTADIAADISGSQVENVLLQPRYTGQDITGRQWHVLADKADQETTLADNTTDTAQGALAGAMLLTNVQADYTATDAANTPAQPAVSTASTPTVSPTFSLSADKGIYRHASATLVLQNNVVLQHGPLQFVTPRVTTQLNLRQASGNQGVTITGPTGGFVSTVTGQTFTVDQPAGLLTVSGQVKARLQPQANSQ